MSQFLWAGPAASESRSLTRLQPGFPWAVVSTVQFAEGTSASRLTPVGVGGTRSHAQWAENLSPSLAGG